MFESKLVQIGPETPCGILAHCEHDAQTNILKQQSKITGKSHIVPTLSKKKLSSLSSSRSLVVGLSVGLSACREAL